jgi:hypothetical protein
VNDTDIMLAAYDERMRGAAGFVAEEPETVLIGLAGDLATTSVLPEGGAGDLAGAAERQPPRALSALEGDTAIAGQAADRIHLRRTG